MENFMWSGIKILIVRKRWEIDHTFIKISFHDVTRERERERKRESLSRQPSNINNLWAIIKIYCSRRAIKPDYCDIQKWKQIETFELNDKN